MQKKIKSFFRFHPLKNDWYPTCPECKIYQDEFLEKTVFSYNMNGEGLKCNYCGWEECKDKNTYQHFYIYKIGDISFAKSIFDYVKENNLCQKAKG